MNANPIITLDAQLAVESSVARLAAEFDGTFNSQTIERLLQSSFDEFSANATVSNFVPLLAERFTRQRLQALALVEGRHVDGKPVVLFLCAHNAGRSQMALGFFEHYAGDAAIAWSGGTEPSPQVNAVAVAAMAERGIDISGYFPKPWTDEIVRAADVVVTMGCAEACPLLPGTRYEEWTVTDPEGLELTHVRPLRDDIEARVLRLLDQLDVSTAH